MDKLPTKSLFEWYDLNYRDLPWRSKWPSLSSPYNVLVSEFMLQQTQVKVVIPYYNEFIKKWPNLYSLSKSGIDDVLNAWAGLGYYSRARNLHKTSKIIISEYDGIFPRDIKLLKKLPGIGEYTSAAILLIAFNQIEAAIDTNIKRILIRYFGKYDQSNLNQNFLKIVFKNSLQFNRNSDFPQALMDLATSICKVKNPECNICPLNVSCKTFQENLYFLLKRKKNNINKKPIRKGTIFVIFNQEGKILMERRPDKGLFASMLVLPGYGWDNSESISFSKLEKLNLKTIEKKIIHNFSHFKTLITVKTAYVNQNLKIGKKYNWYSLNQKNLPNLMLKCLKLVND